MKKQNKIIYCGGNFEFMYKDYTFDKLKTDYRASILGSAKRLVKSPKNYGTKHTIYPHVQYVGPFYFYEEGLDGDNVVGNEIEMVKRCTDAIFLIDNTNIPGTVTEIVHAAMLGKKITIFYVKQSLDEGEPEKEICSANWYPLEFAKRVAGAELIECSTRIVAKIKIDHWLQKWESECECEEQFSNSVYLC